MARKRPKEVELNIDEDKINKADLKSSSNKGVKPMNRAARRKNSKTSSSKGRSKPNDKSWHSNPKQLVSDAASFATQYPIGVRVPSGYCGMATSLGQTDNYGVQNLTPAIMVMDFIPTAGLPTDSQAPVNQAARLQYAYVRYANSGSPVGNPSHLMKFYIAADSLYMLHQTGVRAYGCLSQVNFLNQYLPKTLVEALGFDYEDLVANAAQFRYTLNLMAMKLRRITVPNNMDYLKRHLWMVQGIYTDSESPRAQMYAFRPVAFYKYVEDTKENLEYKKVPSVFTVQSFTQLANELIDAVLQSESFGVTTADILKAYGGDNLVILPEITDTYQVIPIYSQEVMAIVENATVMDISAFNWDTSFILEDDLNPLGDNWIKVKQPYINYTAHISYADEPDLANKLVQALHNIVGEISPAMQIGTLLNVHSAVNQEDIMTFTSLTSNFKVKVQLLTNTTTKQARVYFTMTPIAVRSELVINARIWSAYQTTYINGDSSNLQIKSVSWITSDFIDVGVGTSSANVASFTNYKDTILKAAKFRSLLDSFDWHPACPSQYIKVNFELRDSVSVNSKVETFEYYGDARDLENVIYLTQSDLMRMAEVDLISLFDAPEIAILSAKPYNKAR